MELKLNVYDKENNVVKTCEARTIEIKFGSIRRIMKLLNVDDINDTVELLKIVYGAWDQLTTILDEVFPGMEETDWDNVKLNELVPILVIILKDSFAAMLTIPTDPKN